MKKALLLCIICLLAICKTDAQKRQGSPVGEVTVIRGVHLIDVVSGSVVSDQDIVIENGVIREITQHYVPEKGERVIDAAGKYALPGLIDAHIHLANDPGEPRESRVRILEYLLRHGITTVRDAAGDARVLTELKRAVAIGEVAGPDIYFAAFLAGPSYFEGNDREDEMAIGMDTNRAPWLQCLKESDELDWAMVAAKACGASGVKIYGGFDKTMTCRLVEAAQRHGLETWGHATLFPAKPHEVAEAGVKVISHAYMLEWEEVEQALDPSMFRNYELYSGKLTHKNIPLQRLITAMKRQNAIFDPTLYLCMENQMDWSADITQILHENGVRVCAGTDWMTDTTRNQPFLFDEMALYVERCGFTPMDAIRSATIIAAEACGMHTRIGSIEQGKMADILLLDGNPVEDFSNIRKISIVIKRGKVVGRE